MRGRHLRKIRFEVELELFSELLGVLVSGGTIIPVVHPQHRNVRLHLAQHVQDHDVLRLETAGQARRLTTFQGGRNDGWGNGHVSISSRAWRTAATASVWVAAIRAA